MRPTFRVLSAAAITLVAAAMLVAGFVIVGGPGTALRRTRDEQRANGLSSVVATINSFANETRALPTAAQYDALWAASSPWEASYNTIYLEPGNPLINERPRYQPTGPNTYRLCATFETENLPEPSVLGNVALDDYRAFRIHSVGETCFDRQALALVAPPSMPTAQPLPDAVRTP